MKQNNHLAYLRQLCCSGLSKEIVMPEFLRTVKTVIPSDSNMLTGVDEQFVTSYYMLEFAVADDIAELIPVTVSGFLTPERRIRAAAWYGQHPALTDYRILDESFYMSDLYNLVFQRLDQHHCLIAPVIQFGKPVVAVSLFRSRQQKPFNSREQLLCLRLLPYVAHALMHQPDDKDIQYSENGLSGMMLLDAQGTILYISQEAKKLLALANQPVLTLNACIKGRGLLAMVSQLCRNLEAIFRGQAAAPPSYCYTGPNGRFIFRAYWLDKQNDEPGGLIGMTIEHQEPIVLKILRALRNLPLSPTQKEVVALLAQGFSNEKIGERLHIKLTTVKDHIGKIFIKLDIHRREELLPMLLAADSSMPIVISP